MLVRLWWKEMRLLRPIWVFLVLVALAGQWLGLRYFVQEVHQGALFGMALGLACLYGVAVAASAFAGEREHGTLRLLDTMGVDRRLLWGGKFSFATGSTLALLVVLCGLAALGTERSDALLAQESAGSIALVGGGLLFEAIGWGLFWSALSNTALGAALLTILSVGLITPLSLPMADRNSRWFVEAVPLRLVLAAAATLASAAIMTWRQQRSSRAQVRASTEAMDFPMADLPVRREWEH